MDIRQVDKIRGVMGLAGSATLPEIIAEKQKAELKAQVKRKKAQAKGLREFARNRVESREREEKRRYNKLNKGRPGHDSQQNLRWKGELMKRYRTLAEVVAARNLLQAGMDPARWYSKKDLRVAGLLTDRHQVSDTKWCLAQGLIEQQRADMDPNEPASQLRGFRMLYRRTDKPAMTYEPTHWSHRGIYRLQELRNQIRECCPMCGQDIPLGQEKSRLAKG